MNSCYTVIHKTATLHTRVGVGASLGRGCCLDAAGLGVTVLARLVPLVTLHTRYGVGASLDWGRCLKAAGLGVTVLARLVPIGHTSYQGWCRFQSWLGPVS